MMKHLLALNKTLVVVTTVLGLTLCSLGANAQPERAGHGRGPEQLMQKLGLNEDQKQQFLAIMKEQHEKRIELHGQYRDSRSQEHQAMETLHQQTIERLQPLLTEDQLSQFEYAMKHRRPPHRGRK